MTNYRVIATDTDGDTVERDFMLNGSTRANLRVIADENNRLGFTLVSITVVSQ